MVRFKKYAIGICAAILLASCLSFSQGSSEPVGSSQFVPALGKEAAAEKLFGKDTREVTQILGAINSQGTVAHRHVQVTVWIEKEGAEELYGTFLLTRLLLPHDSIIRDISDKKIKVVKVEFGFKDGGIFDPMHYKSHKASKGKFLLYAAIVWTKNDPAIIFEEYDA